MAKLIWTGSDTLFASRFVGGQKFPTLKKKYPYFWAMTVFAKIADIFVQEHYVVSEHLIKRLEPLKLKKPIKVLVDPPKPVEKLKMVSHEGFNILYYCPIQKNYKFFDWCYGIDIFHRVKWRFSDNKDVNFFYITGEHDMDKVYPYVDFYLRPNRSDGEPRMVMECEALGIPYYWTKENPSYRGAVQKINNELKKWRSENS